MNRPDQPATANREARAALPDRIADVEALEELLSRPDAATAREISSLEGDIAVIGVAGKIGPTLARMAKRAAPEKRVIGVARFSDAGLRDKLESWGVETVQCDLLDPDALARLPKAENMVFMAGRKFGSAGDQPLTWAMNVQVPGLVADIYRNARIVAYSTGCVYPFVPLSEIGATEETPLDPPGEYANSCVGRERLFEYYSQKHGTPGRLFRLNYAIDLRYGVLHDLARTIRAGEPVDVTTGHVNVIWQGDSTRYALRALAHATTPTTPLNVSGPEVLSVAWLARELARRMECDLHIIGEPAETAWLNNSAKAFGLFGYPEVPITKMLDWVADWVARDMPSLDKPTKFENRDGRY